MKGIYRKLAETGLALAGIFLCGFLLILGEWPAQYLIWLMAAMMGCVLAIGMLWVPRSALLKTARESITKVEIVQLPGFVVKKTYAGDTNADVIDAMKWMCKKHYKAFPYDAKAVRDVVIKLTVEDDVEPRGFCIYQSKEQPNWLLCAWDEYKPNYAKAFEVTDEERDFIETLLGN